MKSSMALLVRATAPLPPVAASPLSAIGVAEALRELQHQRQRRISRSVVPMPGASSTTVEEQLASFTITGTLCQEARVHKQPAVALCTAVADGLSATERSSVRLLVSKFATASTSDAEGRVWFPRGARVSIVEPRVVWAGQMVAFMVDNPASIEFLGMEHFSADYSTADKSFQAAGVAFSRGEFLRAALLYRDCVEQGFSSPFRAYSRSCEAWFRMQCYEKAYLDADQALEEKPHHFGSLMVKGRALSELQEYRAALRCFKQADGLELTDQERKKLLEAQTKCSSLYKQSVSGKFNVSEYLFNGKASSSAPQCSDYVGAVRMDMVEGMGRGIFACKDFKAGEVIIASRSLERAAGGEEFHAKLGRSCMMNRKVVAQLTAFFDDKTLPDLDVFRPNSGWLQSSTDHLRPSSSYRDLFNEMGKRNGLCPLATMLNHSCVPNSSRQPVGDSLFVRAARDISTGEELTASYFDPFFPRIVRHKQAEGRNFTFTCRCPRCKVEENLEKQKPDLWVKYDVAMRGKDEQALRTLGQVADELEALMDRSGVDGEARKWVMCSYLYAYWAWTYFSPGKSKSQRKTMLEKLLEAMHSTVPGYLHTLGKMVELAKTPERGSRTREMLEKEVLSCFGEQSMEVVDSLIKSPGVPKDELSY